MPDIQHIHRYSSIHLPAFRYIPAEKALPQNAMKLVHIPKIPDQSFSFSIENWQKSERYLYAIDLFNYGYYWEVHEVLEKIWLELGKTSSIGIFIQGIIQLSVAMVKRIESNASGVKRLLEKALPKLQSQKGICLGIEIENFIKHSVSFILSETDSAPIILLHFE